MHIWGWPGPFGRVSVEAMILAALDVSYTCIIVVVWKKKKLYPPLLCRVCTSSHMDDSPDDARIE